VPPRQPF